MKVNIQAVNFNVDRKLVDFINVRMEKIEKFYDKLISVDVFLRVENTSDKENKCVDIKLGIPGEDLVVKKQFKTFEEGVDSASESLARLLIKKKEKTRV